jgi:alcohol dehydrogenase (cytochrome c)
MTWRGMTWLPGTYDPDLNLIYWGAGQFFQPGTRGRGVAEPVDGVGGRANPTPALRGLRRHHMTRADWDNVETPVLFDATIDGRPVVCAARRAGYFSFSIARRAPPAPGVCRRQLVEGSRRSRS